MFDRVKLEAYMNALEGVTVEEAVARITHGGTIR
jgi:ribosomal protein L12E/L44/L45/RPP1/RPP2